VTLKQLADIAAQGGDLQARSDAYLRRRMLEFVTDYRRRGNAAMLVYDDAGGVRVSGAFAALLAQSPYLYAYVPSFRNYLAAYPMGELPGARERLFWAATSVSGLRPTLTVNHMIWYSPPELSATTLIAVKQIYASHYAEAAFSLTAAVDRSPADSYLVVLQRLRFDRLPDGPMRDRVIGKLRDAFRDQLLNQKRLAEQAKSTLE
jgi:hypothetical protein